MHLCQITESRGVRQLICGQVLNRAHVLPLWHPWQTSPTNHCILSMEPGFILRLFLNLRLPAAITSKLELASCRKPIIF